MKTVLRVKKPRIGSANTESENIRSDNTGSDYILSENIGSENRVKNLLRTLD